jgi:CHAT domain-containing protein
MQQGLDAIREARRELDEVIDEIRKIPGYESFLAAPTFEDVARAATQQPLVYIAAAELGGLALVVRGDDVVHIPLPRLTSDVVHERVFAYQRSYDRSRTDQEAGMRAWKTALDDTTTWLWDEVMEPVLHELLPAPAAVLVVGGLLGLLPLHAAWTPDDAAVTRRRHALDALTLTYTPNARSLTAARELASRSVDTMLAVVGPSPDPLPGILAQARAAASSFPGAAKIVEGPEATPSRVSGALGAADVVHFACHGEADLGTPLDSALELFADSKSQPDDDADGRLRLRDLLALPRLDLRLAVLSACETSVPGTELPDEVVALPTGLLQAGVGGVVASLWRVPEPPTTRLMIEFYRRWRWEQVPPATALREAQQWLRDTTNGTKVQWYEQALASGAGWLPGDAAGSVMSDLYLLEPDVREDAGLDAWAAFTFVGA